MAKHFCKIALFSIFSMDVYCAYFRTLVDVLVSTLPSSANMSMLVASSEIGFLSVITRCTDAHTHMRAHTLIKNTKVIKYRIRWIIFFWP